MAPPEYTLILDQSAHLDWDWICTFAQNYWYYTTGSGVDDIIAQGIKYIQQDPARKYYYTVCEMGFFRRFIETHPDQISVIKNLGDNFQVISGGVTSADCLVCSGEGFIRNYLVGQTWLKQTLGMTAKPHCWLPDDFGQGPELPVLLSALGFVSVAFSRLPGTYNYPNYGLCDDLVQNGLDFIWDASDGSSAFAHYMIDKYSFGNSLSTEDPVTAMKSFVEAYGPSNSTLPTYTAAKTPYMYIPIDDDFRMPIDGKSLSGDISNWNTNYATENNVTFVQGTFDQFMNGVMNNADKLEKRSPYNGTPYMTGYYASRPQLKSLHYDTVRALNAAEVIGLLTLPSCKTVNSMLPTDFWTRVDQAWADFAPSTHHDYICGTAPDAVYANEQLPVLRGAAAAACSLQAAAFNALAGMVRNNSGNSTGVMVANPLGFARSGLAAIEGIQKFASTLTWSDSSGTTKTQLTSDGGMLVYASAPSFGYITGNDSGQSAEPMDSVTITPNSSGAASYTITNEYLTATITENAGWGLQKLIDRENNNAEVLSANEEDIGNAIVFYDDSNGDIYQFGNEAQGGSMNPIQNVKVTTSGVGLGAMVIETGPLLAKLRTEVQYEVPTRDGPVERRFIREYQLRVGERFLRMTTTGAAPADTSVMTTFPLARKVNGMMHGTGYHWTNVQPASGYWGAPVFRATHDFLIPYDSNNEILAGIYHSAVPAWASDTNGALIGCLLRNTPNNVNHHGAQGSDPAVHTQHYALRVPSRLWSPETSQPLREAQSFHTPLLAAKLPDVELPSSPGPINAQSGSLAAVGGEAAAILTVAKPGSYDSTSLILRIYQSLNETQSVRIKLPSAPLSSKLVTAAETEWTGKGSVTNSSQEIIVTMGNAVATVAIAGMGRGSDTS